MVSIPDFLLVKNLDFLNLDKVLYDSYLTSGARIILSVNLIVWPSESKRLDGGFLFFRSTNNASNLGNFQCFLTHDRILNF